MGKASWRRETLTSSDRLSSGSILELLEQRAVTGVATQQKAGRRASSAIRRFAEGFTDEPQLVEELRVLGYSGLHLQRLVFSARLDRSRAFMDARVDLAIQEFRRDQLPGGLLQARLIEAGLSQEFAALKARNEMLRRAPPTTRPTALGLQLLPEAVGLLAERPVRPTALGLSIITPPTAGIPEDAPRPVAVGLQLVVPEVPERDLAPLRPTAVGLRITVPPAGGVPEAEPRPVAVFLQVITPRRR